jgi:hypothetical protein
MTVAGEPVAERPEFVWIAVHNDSIYPGDGDLNSATARLYFHLPGNATVDMRGRWRNSPQLVQTGGDFAGITDRIVIRANDREELDAVIRWPGHDPYALNTEAMRFPLWEDPSQRLPAAELLLVVRVSAQNHGARRAAFLLDLTSPDALMVRPVWRLPLPLIERQRPSWWPWQWH